MAAVTSQGKRICQPEALMHLKLMSSSPAHFAATPGGAPAKRPSNRDMVGFWFQREDPRQQRVVYLWLDSALDSQQCDLDMLERADGTAVSKRLRKVRRATNQSRRGERTMCKCTQRVGVELNVRVDVIFRICVSGRKRPDGLC